MNMSQECGVSWTAEGAAADLKRAEQSARGGAAASNSTAHCIPAVEQQTGVRSTRSSIPRCRLRL